MPLRSGPTHPRRHAENINDRQYLFLRLLLDDATKHGFRNEEYDKSTTAWAKEINPAYLEELIHQLSGKRERIRRK